MANPQKKNVFPSDPAIISHLHILKKRIALCTWWGLCPLRMGLLVSSLWENHSCSDFKTAMAIQECSETRLFIHSHHIFLVLCLQFLFLLWTIISTHSTVSISFCIIWLIFVEQHLFKCYQWLLTCLNPQVRFHTDPCPQLQTSILAANGTLPSECYMEPQIQEIQNKLIFTSDIFM